MSRRIRSQELLNLLKHFEHIVVVTHDNPDPDAISAGWALCHLVESVLGREPRLIGGGAVVRAENRHMMNLLRPPIELVQNLRPRKPTAAVLVDCGPQVAGHLLNSRNIETVGVVDHHLTGSRPHLPFVDIRPRVAASASMVSEYLREQNVVPGERLATALLYAIRTETCGNEFHHTRLDRSVILWLTRFANPEWIAEIQNAPLQRNYYGDLVLALQNTFLHADAAFCLLPRAQGQEIVGEVADLLIRCDDVKRVFCGAAIGGDLFCSVRTREPSENAAALVKATLKGRGFGGGHNHRAGGKIPRLSSGRITDSLIDDLRQRWLTACHVLGKRGVRLIRRKEIVQTLKGHKP